MKLIIVHYHLRPGGIRRVIELATPHLRRAGRFQEIVLAGGEATDPQWNDAFSHALAPAPVTFFIDPVLGYVSEQRRPPQRLRRGVVAALGGLLADATAANTVVWAHNLGIARNLVLADELARACDQRGIPLLSHHHDWWFDSRWLRWPEMRRYGVRNLTQAARTVFPATKTIRHAAISQAEASVLQRHYGRRAGWLPNLCEPLAAPSAARIRTARQWLRSRVGDPDAPVWILPCRLLRRKNVAEALLLTRWLRPRAWLVTTGGVSSREEEHYYRKLERAAQQHRWPLRLGLLAGNPANPPAVSDLLAASECVLLTSIQEGFGLPYLEAAAAGRPLIARALPNIAPDLAAFGFRFPQYYEDVRIPTTLFDWRVERTRQEQRFQRWRRGLPAALRSRATAPALCAGMHPPRAVPFSRLTLDAQLEVLAQPVEQSWQLCAPLNPFLNRWQERAARGSLRVTPWPRQAERWLSGAAYARNFLALLGARADARLRPQTALRTQTDFFDMKLGNDNNYPLFWETKS